MRKKFVPHADVHVQCAPYHAAHRDDSAAHRRIIRPDPELALNQKKTF
ncbi:MAG: hypothetical protein SPC23_07930 [Lachnospiraceae bacterium]|nr:hypothetical protein [Lachnospiraceae bacterium]